MQQILRGRTLTGIIKTHKKRPGWKLNKALYALLACHNENRFLLRYEVKEIGFYYFCFFILKTVNFKMSATSNSTAKTIAVKIAT